MAKKPATEDLQQQITANLAATTRILKEAAEAQAARDTARDKAQAKRDAARDKAEAERAKAQAERDKLADESHAKLKKDLAETGKMVKTLTQESGEAANNRGFSFERAAFVTLSEMKHLCGHLLEDVIFNLASGKKGYQYDMLGINGKYAIVIEAKTKLSAEGVIRFAAERLPVFAKVLPGFAKGKKVIGAMIYQQTDPGGKAVKEALSRGLLVLCADSAKHLTHIKTPADLKERHQPPRKK
ncbi:MAG: hypothetical protein ACR2P4_08190 [Gammaproteobacteria bacterium]